MLKLFHVVLLSSCIILLALSGCLRPSEQVPKIPVVVEPVKSVQTTAPQLKKTPVVEPDKIILLLSDNNEIYRSLSNQIKSRLPSANVFFLSELGRDGLQSKLDSEKGPLIALGVEAAQASVPYAKSRLVVFSLVFNYWDAQLLDKGMVGVGMLPKQDQVLHLAHDLFPGVKKMVLPIGPGMGEYADAAKHAAERLGVDLLVTVIHSDKELMLYAAKLDRTVGIFWLLPDNRILSSNAIRQLLSTNLKIGRSNIVFSSELFSFGGLISASYSLRAISDTIISILKSSPIKQQKMRGTFLQPNGATLSVNQELAEKLNIDVPSEWQKQTGP